MRHHGENALASAFKDHTLRLATTSGIPDNTPLFTYVLTQKQMGMLNRICSENSWANLVCPGITIHASDIKHALTARGVKDDIPHTVVAEILAGAYSHLSDVWHNKPSSKGSSSAGRAGKKQTILLNAAKYIRLDGSRYHAMAILEIVNDKTSGTLRLEPRTAYHATESKVRGIKK